MQTPHEITFCVLRNEIPRNVTCEKKPFWHIPNNSIFTHLQQYSALAVHTIADCILLTELLQQSEINISESQSLLCFSCNSSHRVNHKKLAIYRQKMWNEIVKNNGRSTDLVEKKQPQAKSTTKSTKSHATPMLGTYSTARSRCTKPCETIVVGLTVCLLSVDYWYYCEWTVPSGSSLL